MKILDKINNIGNKLKKKVSKINNIGNKLKKKVSNKEVFRKNNKVTVDVSQPVYSHDKSRFFKTAWEIENKQLYFD